MDLRDRIAAVLEIHLQGSHEDGFDTEEVLALADAVIRDVLTPEFLADLVIEAIQKAADDA